MQHHLARGARYQRYLFAILSLLLLMLSVDILGLIGVGDPKASGALHLPASKTAAWDLLDPGARQMLDRQHEAIVAEIRLRIEQEHLLFALKFVLVGGILWAFLQTAFRGAESAFEPTPLRGQPPQQILLSRSSRQ